MLDVEVGARCSCSRSGAAHDERLPHQDASTKRVNRADGTHVLLIGRLHEEVVIGGIRQEVVEGTGLQVAVICRICHDVLSPS